MSAAQGVEGLRAGVCEAEAQFCAVDRVDGRGLSIKRVDRFPLREFDVVEMLFVSAYTVFAKGVDLGIASVVLDVIVGAGIVVDTTVRRWRRRRHGGGLCLKRLCFKDLPSLHSLPSTLGRREVGSSFEKTHSRPSL